MPKSSLSTHESFMRAALELARPAGVLPYPNPWVGCVVVRDRKIVGRGSHRGAGTPHAEIEALRQAGKQARNGTLYVTLEPCCHFGRTPPCTDAILRAGIRKVYFAINDPNPLVRGRSARLLKSHGVEVERGLCARAAATLNEVYLKYRATGLPFVTAKVAASLDGKIATRTGESKWLTDATARKHARRLRAGRQAVLVGINTVLKDNPHLGSRIRGAPDPWRVVLDSGLRTPLTSQVIRSRKCILACADRASAQRQAQLERRGAQVWRFSGQRVPLKRLMARLAEREIISVLVEGGGEVLGSFFDEKLVDRLYWYLAPIILGSHLSRGAVAGRGVARIAHALRLATPHIKPIGNSWLIQGNLSRWAR